MKAKLDVPFYPYQSVFYAKDLKVFEGVVLGYRYIDKKLNSIEIQLKTSGGPLAKVDPKNLFDSEVEAWESIIKEVITYKDRTEKLLKDAETKLVDLQKELDAALAKPKVEETKELDG